jgi:hypothetical protein
MAMSLFGKTQLRRPATLAVGAVVTVFALGASSALAQQAAAPVQAGATTAPAKAAKAPAKKKSQDEQTEAAASAPSKKDPAEAIRQVDGGIKLLQASKAEQAIQTLSVAISSGALPSTHMARALHQRGAAYRVTGKPALAISDLTSALWLKGGLAEADRQDAVKQRAEAYREAGLPDQTGDDGRPAGATSTKRATASPTTSVAAPAPVATASLAPNATAPVSAAPSTGNLLQTLFGGLGKSQAAATQPAPTQPTPAAASGPSGPATSAWSSAVQPARTPRAATAAPASPSAAAPAAPVKTASIAPLAQAAATAPATTPATAQPGVHARIALVRNEAEAQPILDRLKSQHAAALGKKSATLSPAQFGGMGAFVQVRVGPYPNLAEANAFCAKLKGSNLDCVAVDR